jgi:2,4-dienoyl-CoA reductase-like NADH-dependent reductase (Old Yellow Enzyme family)/thioredoxin reductase
MAYFSSLFKPGYIGKLRFKNRIIMAPISSNFPDENGAVTEQMTDFYLARAQAAVGAILLENTNVDFPAGKNGATQLRLDSVEFMPGLNRFVERLKNGCGSDLVVGIQLNHAGSLTSPQKNGGVQPVAPSAVPFAEGMAVPRELTVGGIEEIVEKFGDAAARAKTIGFDFVETHSGHGYLIEQFMSSLTNKRKDEYGGSFEGMMKFPLDIIRNIRRKAGEDFAIVFELTCDTFIESERDIEWGVRVAKLLEAEGIDAIYATAGTPRIKHSLLGTFSYEQGWQMHLAERIKEAVGIPVIVNNTIREPEFADRILGQGKADFVALGRGLIAEPQWARKAQEGRSGEINRCISCNICTFSRSVNDVPIRCTVNPEVGHESELKAIGPAQKKLKVLVVGGGPAGMEAAFVAASRGHRVSLYERQGGLGGQLNICSTPEEKRMLGWFKDYLRQMLELNGVDVHVNTEATLDLVKSESPDAVVVATGSEPIIPGIPGVDAERSIAARSVYGKEHTIEGKDIVIVGGGQVGYETADFLRSKNNRITVVEMLESLAPDAEPIYREEVISKLEKDPNVKIWAGTKVVEVKEGSVVVEREGKKQSLDADLVLFAVGACPLDRLAEDISREMPALKLSVVGDSRRARSILEATREAYWAVMNL